MARSRLDLHEILCEIMQPYLDDENREDRRVYFRSPSNSAMRYPCIRYDCPDMDIKYADNRPYIVKRRYDVTVIDPNPDSLIPDKLLELPFSVGSSRNYVAEGLNHFVMTIFF